MQSQGLIPPPTTKTHALAEITEKAKQVCDTSHTYSRSQYFEKASPSCNDQIRGIATS